MHDAKQTVDGRLGVMDTDGHTTVTGILDYMRHITDAIPTSSGGASSPIDVKQVTASIALVTMLFTLIGRTAFLAAWPIVLFVWAGRLQRETSPTL